MSLVIISKMMAVTTAAFTLTGQQFSLEVVLL